MNLHYLKKHHVFVSFCLLGLTLLVCTSCERCEDREPSINVLFVDQQSGQELQPEFTSVREQGINSTLVNFNEDKQLPLNLNADTVTYIFTSFPSNGNQERVDTLRLTYARELDYAGDSYCMKFNNEDISLSTFEVLDFTTNNTYEISLIY